MANKVTKFLGNVVGGIFGGEGDMRDYQHAARLFTDDFMRLAPKVEFLYHVNFEIDDGAVRTPGAGGWNAAEPRIELGMLVKACQVPGVTVNTETKNQYGKKTNIQTAVQYTPVQISFHDDNSNLVSGMWQQYFKNYYADSNWTDELQKQPTYNANTSDGEYLGTRQSDYKFGFDNFKSVRFFKKINIYQLSRHRFFQYSLINPIIQSWTPPNLNASSSQPAENQMTVIYEGIEYAEGDIGVEGNPKGFAQLHYDGTPSPMSLMGGGTAGLFGANGVLAGGLDVFGDIASGRAFSSPFALLGTALKAKSTYDGAKQLTRDGIIAEAEGIVTRAITTTANNTIRVPGSNTADQTRATQAQGPAPTVANTKSLQDQANGSSVTISAAPAPAGPSTLTPLPADGTTPVNN